jgi:predicted AAA+ superfamily ATPase
MAEQFVMQELTCTSPDYLGYWTNERSTSEVDFVLQKNGAIVPIEVKSGENLGSRSFTLFCDKFKPDLAVKTSMLPFHDNEKMLNVPLYGIATVETSIKSGKGAE